MDKTLEDCAKTLEGLEGEFRGIDHLAASLRKGEIPLLLMGKLNSRANVLSRVTDRIREIVTEEQRKALEEAHGQG
jgi:uncharacterized protein YoxC